MVERARRRRREEGGATAVEFALFAPILFLVVFGIIDFGWAYSQNVDLRSAAREGARIAVVNEVTGEGAAATSDLIQRIRVRSTQLEDEKTEVAVTLVDSDNDSTYEIGESLVICMRYPLRSISGVSDTFISGHLATKAIMRLEKVPTYTSGASTGAGAWSGGTCGM